MVFPCTGDLVPCWCLLTVQEGYHSQWACAICFYLISVPPENLSPSTDHFCLSRLSTDSQRSHLSSFTMKLKDKFHSPKIKRIPSKKGKQQQHEPPAKCTEKPANKVCVRSYGRNSVCVLWEIHLFPSYSFCLFAYL